MAVAGVCCRVSLEYGLGRMGEPVAASGGDFLLCAAGVGTQKAHARVAWAYLRALPGRVVSGSGSGGDAKVLLDVLEDAVADGAGLLDVAGLEREAKALCRGIRFVDGDMAPPHSPVVPQVMVRVVIIDPHGNLGLLRHGMYVLF